MTLQEFLARNDVEYVIASEADGSVEGTCPAKLINDLKELADACTGDGGQFEYATKGENIFFSFWSPSI